jgi:Carboxypeptidase regulatory-like domain/TonB dependent receptor
MRKAARLWAGPALACLFYLASGARAQLTEGTIAGTVTDPSGAAVRGATVTATNLGTSFEVQTTSDNIGYYRVPHCSPGTYEVRVEKNGFKAALVQGVVVSVGVVTRADVSLRIGSVSESVAVSEITPLVQTEEGRLTNTLTPQEVTNLPLNGRQIYQLVSLEPGVTATNAPVISNVPSPTSSVTFDFGYVANGATPRGNNFVLDGNSNNNEWLGGTPLIYPSLDAIQEVQVETLNFSAEYGRNNGTVVNVITKSGTNQFHGDLFYSGRNTALDARNYFDDVEKTPLQQNQFGATFGGPVIHDKTFFFLDYEGSRLKDGQPEVVTTETPAYRQSVIAGQPKSIAAIFFQDFPGPNCTPGTVNGNTCSAIAPQIEHNDADQYLIRLDHNITSRDQFYARWVNTIASGDVARQELEGANIRGFTAPFTGFFADLGLGYTHEFSSDTINDLRFAYSRNNSDIRFGIPPNTTTAAILKAHDLPPDSFGDLVFDDGTIPIGGELYIPRKFIFNTFAVTDTLTRIIGRHSLKIGGDVRRIQENSDYTLETYPYYEFASIEAFAADAPYLVAATIDRNPGSTNFGGFTDTPRHFRWSQWALFVQDDWKVFSRLTVNAGLRYEVFVPPSETNGILSNITLGSGSTLFQQIAAAKVGRVSSMWNTDYHNFAPRLGMAWDPTGKGTTAIRSGFSIAYDEPYSNLYTNASRLDPPDAATMYVEPAIGIGTSVNYQFPFEPSPDFAGAVSSNGGVEPISPTAAAPSITPSGVYPNLRTAYSLQWFLGVQQQFLRDYGFSINYVGTRGVGGYTREDYNRFDGDVCNPTECNYFATRLAPGWGEITYITNESQSTYQGMNAQLKKTYNHGVMFIANYTYGKVLDNVTEGGLGDYFNVNSYAANYSGVMDIDHPRLDRGPAEFDVRNRFTGTAIWNLPSPKSEGAIGKLAGGWQLNTILTLQSGRPFDVDCTLGWYDGCDFNMDGDYYARPNRPAGMELSGFSNQQFVEGLFGNPALTFYGPTFESRTSSAIETFCPNGLNSILDFGPVSSGPDSQCIPVGQDGNMGRNIFRGPAFKDVDLGFFKNTKVGERLNVQFRAEAFNLFNRVNLYNPIGNMGSPQFGQSVSAFSSREFQLGLKFLF